MKNISKVLALFLMLMLIACSMCCFASCEDDSKKNNDAPEGFYSLKEAYDKGLLTQADLQAIADLHNHDNVCEDPLDAEVSFAIRKAWLKDYIEKGGDTEFVKTEEDVAIYSYYGTYNKCVACIIEPKNAAYIAVFGIVSVDVGGATFRYPVYRPLITIWKIA